jgi:fatty acid desaturase
MLRAEEKRSRWLGMDMRPRWRRRIAVVVTYIAFLVALGSAGAEWWGHPMVATGTLVFTVWWLGVFGNFGPRAKTLAGDPGSARMITKKVRVVDAT